MSVDFIHTAALLKALADPVRASIMHILSCGEVCVCQLHQYFTISQPTLSHHLSILRKHKLITTRKEGKWSYHSVNATTVKELSRLLDEIFIPGSECLCHTIRQVECSLPLRQDA
ncbi:MAG: metalloregulator ArsR/SmtB family transcription factor [Sphaerochaeta sp.]|jgi:ArsR family transcriptional regulator|nr:metalloregulator ArsR/SmtB family transcription factor [Sphaerochaeta sp.]MDX9916347.1 metalloregulator ArsR/SmtB family transcription factor [Sphaerochaeta sp.]